ncbi:MAG: nucleoside phosphorylase [Candidatus Bathyarchaeia archaeon]
MHPADVNGRQYHIGCRKGDLAEYLLVPGDPDRIPKIAKFWDSAREVSCHREFRSVTGAYKGIPISALSSGIGPACMSIVVNEASTIGVHTFIRVGSSGAIQENIECGDLVISSAAVRLDYTSNCYILPEYPAVANHEVLLALIEAAEALGLSNYHVGITATTSDFYAGQNRPTKIQTINVMPALQKAGVLNFEMETATLFTLANIYGLRAGAVCAVYANRCTGKFKPGAGEEDAIKVANEAVKILHEWDERKKAKGKKWLYLSLVT